MPSSVPASASGPTLTPSVPVERFHVARKVTNPSAGVWHYEYAAHNMNSDRAADRLAIRFFGATTFENIGFHDVNAHSNEPYDTADWSNTVTADELAQLECKRAVDLFVGGEFRRRSIGATLDDAHDGAPVSAFSGEPPLRFPPAAGPMMAEEPLPSDIAAYLDEVERDILVRALERHRFNRTAAGASLGLSLRQMRYRMARLGVNVGGDGVERE